MKNLKTPFSGGKSAMGFVASITGFPAKFGAVARRKKRQRRHCPLPPELPRSANAVASAKLPTRASWFSALQTSSFDASRVPIITK